MRLAECSLRQIRRHSSRAFHGRRVTDVIASCANITGGTALEERRAAAVWHWLLGSAPGTCQLHEPASRRYCIAFSAMNDTVVGFIAAKK